MKSQHNIAYIAVVGFFLLVASCKEEFIIETQDFESVLVVEATITNELKHQEVRLSRTYLLEGSEQVFENNAAVSVVDNSDNRFNFWQNNDGVYVSEIPFEALADREYTLLINTSEGKTYHSSIQTLTPISQIDNLYAEFVDDDVKGPGVQIFIDSNNRNYETQYFRYEYEETYKIVVPFSYNLIVNVSNYFALGDICNMVTYDVEFYEKTNEEQTCYRSIKNLEIIQGTTNSLLENNILRFPIRFIKEDITDDVLDTSMLRDRYSILVKQYIQSIEAYNYYRLISLLGNNESILSENQPGFVKGNIQEVNDENTRVIGFFEVASVSEKRVFINYEDANIPYPNYIYSCDQKVLDFNDNLNGFCDDDTNERNQLYILLTRENYKLVLYDEETNIYTIAKQECVNCTSAGSNIQPDFWIN